MSISIRVKEQYANKLISSRCFQQKPKPVLRPLNGGPTPDQLNDDQIINDCVREGLVNYFNVESLDELIKFLDSEPSISFGLCIPMENDLLVCGTDKEIAFERPFELGRNASIDQIAHQLQELIKEPNKFIPNKLTSICGPSVQGQWAEEMLSYDESLNAAKLFFEWRRRFSILVHDIYYADLYTVKPTSDSFDYFTVNR